LVLETERAVAVNFDAPVVELMPARVAAAHRPLAELGPDLMADTPDWPEVLRRFRDPSRSELTIGDAIMDQGVMAGVGNMWKHETLFRCGLNPWLVVAELTDEQLMGMAATAAELLRASAGLPGPEGKTARRPSFFVYMRAGQPCPRCFTRLRSARQGRDIRFTAWCPRCQPGPAGPSARAAADGGVRPA
jgi:endonuclease-8